MNMEAWDIVYNYGMPPDEAPPTLCWECGKALPQHDTTCFRYKPSYAPAKSKQGAVQKNIT